MDPRRKYKPFPGFFLKYRGWPNRSITHEPIWGSVDLRDGNQSIPIPMTVEQKLEMFSMLVRVGFKEIEVGFPSASETEFQFVRRLIEEHLIPDDVTIQVLVQAREGLIKRTAESLIGARRAIIHMYNSTSPQQRRIVFGLEKPDIIVMAVRGTELVKEYSAGLAGTEIVFEYSPESFSATEIAFSVEICNAVMRAWNPKPGEKIIFNLPNTVEVAPPNVYADQVEIFCENIRNRDSVIVSIHSHNDRGTGVAATEFGVLAGADRVEGTLFGNGERMGNADIITLALNLYTQGVPIGLDFSDLNAIREVYERCTGMEVSPRQPYSGKYAFVAFSGSHQDAIKKGLKARELGKEELWDVPYIPMDPSDIGRKYEEIIRVNSQSGKGGIAFILETGFGLRLPKDLQREFGEIAGKVIDALAREVTPDELRDMFWKEYLRRADPYGLTGFQSDEDNGRCNCHSIVIKSGVRFHLKGVGNGPIDAFIRSLQKIGEDVRVLDQAEHSLGAGQDAKAIAYVKLQLTSLSTCWGVGVATSIQMASLYAIISALNRGAH